MGFTRGLGVKNTLSIGEAYNFKMADLEGMDLDLLNQIYEVVHNQKACTVDGQDFLSLDRHRQIKINNEVVRVLNKATRQKKHRETKALGIKKGSIRRITYSNGDSDIYISSGAFDRRGNMVWYTIDGKYKGTTSPSTNIQSVPNEKELLQGLVDRLMNTRSILWNNYDCNEISVILIQLKLLPRGYCGPKELCYQ
jgi:hypothetical protein